MFGPPDSAPRRRAGGRLALALGLLLGSLPGVSRAEPPPPPSAPRVSEPPPMFAYWVGAIGLSGLSVGAVTGFLAMNQQGIAEDHCSPSLRLCDGAGRQASETGRTLRDISTAAWIVGGVGVGLSAYLLLTAPSQPNAVALSVSVEGAHPKAALVAHF